MNLVKSNWFLLILLSAIWGGAFTLNKMALDSFTPEVIVVFSSIDIFFVQKIFNKSRSSKLLLIYELGGYCYSIYCNYHWSEEY